MAEKYQYRQHNKKKNNKNYFFTMNTMLFSFVVSSFLIFLQATNTKASVILSSSKPVTHPVFTYKNASTELGQLVTSSTLIWESYNPKDSKQLQYAVEGGKYITEDQHYPIYICRVMIDGVPTNGHTEREKQLYKCVAAHYRSGKLDNFDVLINKGHLGKIAWKKWRPFNGGIPIGAIAIGNTEYIARRHATQNDDSESDNQQIIEPQWGAEYNFGRLEPNMGLGKIRVLENGTEKYHNEGEILVETEPYRYELREIKIDKLNTDLRDNFTELAFAVLANRGKIYSRVETLMSYNFDYLQYWGTHDGVARGLPTKIIEDDGSKPLEINWGLKYSERRFETKNVHTMLWPGTAMNVTLHGVYASLEAPYTAKLHAFYYGSDESVSRKIRSTVRKSYLKDVRLEYSAVYWLENNTLVPTTTTSTTAATVSKLPMTHINELDSQETLQDSPAAATNNDNISNAMPENLAAKNEKTVLADVSFNRSGQPNSIEPCSLPQKLTIILSTILLLFTTRILQI